MAWKKGQSGNPNGRPNDKPFAETLRLVLKETDTVSGKLKLRAITEALVDKAIAGESWAVQHVMDRVDGKPAQESTVTIDDKRDATDWTRSELVEFLNNARNGGEGTAKAERRGKQSDKVH
jgi:hypothetical protein